MSMFGIVLMTFGGPLTRLFVLVPFFWSLRGGLLFFLCYFSRFFRFLRSFLNQLVEIKPVCHVVAERLGQLGAFKFIEARLVL